MEKYIVDRIEGDFAVLENENSSFKDVELNLIEGCREGDVVIFENGKYRVDKVLTMERKTVIAEKMRKLFGKNH